MDEEMDHGEILGKEEMDLNWEETPISELEYQAGFTGGKIFYNEIDQQKLTKQDHTQATFTKILSKENGNVTEEIKKQNLDLVWRKYNAYRDWPGIYFIMKNLRVKITKMSKDLNSKKISIEKLLPESKNEIDLDVFEKNYGEIF
jgi:methionyl-tRNA formyltransferase